MPDMGWPAHVVPANGCPHYTTWAWAIACENIHPGRPVRCQRCTPRVVNRGRKKAA